MVTETVALRAGPPVAVAVTVTLYVPTIGFGGGPELPEVPQPSVTSTSNIIKMPPITTMRVGRRLRPHTGMMSKTPASPKPEPASHPVCVDAARWLSCAAEAEVETVIASVAMFVPSGVRLGGAKVQVAPAGNPEQANETAWLNPPSGITATDALPDCPTLMETDAVTACNA